MRFQMEQNNQLYSKDELCISRCRGKAVSDINVEINIDQYLMTNMNISHFSRSANESPSKTILTTIHYE